MEHYTGNTVSKSRYCRKCRKQTQHRVDSHRLTNVCLDCQNPESRELVPIVSSIVEVPAPCTCPRYPFGHYHAFQKHGDSYSRFKPGTWEERA